MSISWFVHSNNLVSGPFTTEQVQEKLRSEFSSGQSFIWWKGQREWVQAQVWVQQLPAILQASTMDHRERTIWYLEMGESRLGPITQTELIAHLKNLEDISKAKLWSVGMPKWVGIFELHDIMDQVGLNRREHPRAPLLGPVAVGRSTDDPRGFVLSAASISIGGIGLSGYHDLRRSDELSLLVKSPELAMPLHLRGEVVYVTEKSFVGVRFIQAPAEAQSVIMEYVKRFTEPDAAFESDAA